MDTVRSLESYMNDNPGAVIETVAKDFRTTPRAVVAALPSHMVRIAAGSSFPEVMADISHWGEVTLIVHTDDGIFEFTGPVPKGEIGQGYFNLPGKQGLHGHIRHDRCAEIAFVERPFMRRPSACVIPFNADGGVMLKAFVGRDEIGTLKSDQMARLRALADRLGEPAIR